MATKTRKQLNKYIEKVIYLKKECLRRNPEFIKDVTECWDAIKQLPTKSYKINKEFKEKYGFLPPKNELLGQIELWTGSCFSDVVSMLPTDELIRKKMREGESPLEEIEKRAKRFAEYSILEKNTLGFMGSIYGGFKTSYSPLGYYLEKDRFITVRIDTKQSKEVIIEAISKELDWIIKMKMEYGLKEKLFKVSLDRAKRYFRVYDLRNEKPPVKYRKIALALLKEKYYSSNKTLKQIIDSVKKDYATIFEKIYNIPYKKYDKSKLKKSDFKGCDNCEAKKNGRCKELCPEAEYYLSLFTKKCTEVLFNRGVVDIIHPKDLKAGKQRARVGQPEDEEDWRQKEIERGMQKDS